MSKKLGLPSVIATGIGVIIATSCLLSLASGSAQAGTGFILAMVIACALNILFALSISELYGMMPKLTGGIAQYTMVAMGPFITLVVMVGGYLVCNTLVSATECAMFGNTMTTLLPQVPVSGSIYCLLLVGILIFVNLGGISIFAKVQNVVGYTLIGSLIIMGILGTIKAGTGEVIAQPAVLQSDIHQVMSLCGLAFFLFIGCEFIIPIAGSVKNARRNVPLGMILSLLLILCMQVLMVLGFKNYIPWEQLGSSTTPHILYGTLLMGQAGRIWMAIVTLLAVISCTNTILSSVSYIANGMAKNGLLPGLFAKVNRKGAPYGCILFFGGIVIGINLFDLSASETLSFLILTGNVFWMSAYMINHINVLILRKRMPETKRPIRVPFGNILPILGIIGVVFMILNIDSDPLVRYRIFGVCLLILAGLSLYAGIWVHRVMHRPLFKPVSVREVVAMEHKAIHIKRNPRYRIRGHIILATPGTHGYRIK